MKSIRFELNNGYNTAVIQAESPSFEETDKMFSQVLLFLGVSVNDIEENQVDDIARAYQSFMYNQDGDNAVEAPALEKPASEEPISTLTLVPDKPQEESQISDKHKGTYKAKYICDKCNHKGGRYVKDHSTFIHCHNCNHRMRIVFASSESTYKNFVPNREGYYFITLNALRN